MQKTAFAELVSRFRLSALQQLARFGTTVTGSQPLVEAVLVLEIDQGCLRCVSPKRCQWGHTETNAQRWMCNDCDASCMGLTGTPITCTRRSDLFIDLVRNMDEAETPWSCRKTAEELEISRHTVWRLRMAINRLLPAERAGVMLGIVAADEARQHDSKNASREWVRYRTDALSTPRPLREPWRYHKRNAAVKAPPSDWLAWNMNRVTVTNLARRCAFEAVNEVTEQEVSAALLPTMALGVVLCTGGHAACKKIAKVTCIGRFALAGGKRSGLTPKTHYVNTANTLVAAIGISSDYSASPPRRIPVPALVATQPAKAVTGNTVRFPRLSSTHTGWPTALC